MKKSSKLIFLVYIISLFYYILKQLSTSVSVASVEYSTLATSTSVNNCSIFPNFQSCARCEKDLKDSKDNSRHLGRKYARIFVLGHYLFLVAHSFPRARKTVRFSEQIMSADKYLNALNGDHCLYIPQFSNCARYEKGGSK